MRSDTSRSWRGWLYAVLVAALFSTAFWYVDQYSRWRGPAFTLLSEPPNIQRPPPSSVRSSLPRKLLSSFKSRSMSMSQGVVELSIAS